jgi:cell division protein ZapA
MGQVALTLNGRTYRLACADGDEARFKELAAYVTEKIEALTAEFGQIGEARLLLMGAILIADELFEAGGGPVRQGASVSVSPSQGTAGEGDTQGARFEASPEARVHPRGGERS